MGEFEISQIVLLLKDEDRDIQLNAANALGKIGEVATPYLLPLLQDTDEAIREIAVWALAKMREAGAAAIPYLLLLLQDTNEAIRGIAAIALGNMGTECQEVITNLILLLLNKYYIGINVRDLSDHIKLNIFVEMTCWTYAFFIYAYKDKDKDIRLNATQALGKIGRVAIPYLLPLLQDSDEDVRAMAAIALGSMGEVAIPYLLPLLKDSDEDVRAITAYTLGNMGETGKVAIPYLLPLLKDSDEDTSVRAMAAFALGNMGETGKVAIPYLLSLLKDSDTNIQVMAAITLGNMGEVAIPYLLSLLKDSDTNIRGMAAFALGHMGEAGKVAIPYLLPLLKDSDETVRAMAATALGNMGEAGKVAIPHLLPLLKDSDEDLRAITAYTLGNISVACQTPIFSSGTKDIPIHLGIDFGTTFSSAAILLNGEIKRVKEPSRLGYSFPSSIFVDKQGKVFVGQFAENQRFQDPSSYIREFKRELGKTMSSTWGIRKFLPEDLVSEMFKVLKQEAEKMVNQPIDGVIATIPASYTGYRSELMEKAARNAGFKQVQLLPEPVAAAIYYDHPSSGGKPLAEGEVLLVYDLGGGTFDAALLQKQGSSYQMLAQPVGDENLGGSNFDWAMYQDLQAQCSDTLRALLNPRAQDERAMKTRLRVKDWLREFKHQLSSVEQHTDDLPVGDFESYTLTRQRFEEMIHPQLQTTCGLCNQLVASAGLRWEQVGKILLVGGSCRIPYVQRLLYSQFKRPVEWVDELELAVCLGAAIYREVGQNGSNAIL